MPRYTLEFNEDFDKLLSDLAEEKDVPKSEIIRRALASYAYLEKQVASQQNRKLSITDHEDNVIKDVVLP